MGLFSSLRAPILLLLEVTVLLSIGPVSGDNLLLVQPIWRHGDRSPTTTYPKDPNQESAWPLGWGQLTPIGMNQHIHLGNALYDRYVTQEKFLGKSLNYWEMYIRSTDVNRTLISAYSNLIGMYYGRTEAEPSKNYPNNTRWPGQLVPFPVHSVARDTDYAGDPLAPNCPRLYWLLDKSKETPEYIKLRKDNQKFLDWLTEVCGEEVDLIRLWDIRDATFIERLYNMKTPFDNSTYQKMAKIDDKVAVIEDGLGLTPVDGIDFAIETPKVKGGPMLWTMLDNFDLKLHCTQPQNSETKGCKWMKNLKYYAYSAHDTTLVSLMAALKARIQLVPGGTPSYAACMVFELWNTTTGPAIRVLYRHNYRADFVDVTKHINGCHNLSNKMCPYEKMREAAKVFYPGDPAVLCADVTSTSTDMWHYTIPTPRPNAADTSSTPRPNAADTSSTPRSNAADHIFRMNTILAVFMTAAALLLYYEPA